MAAGRYVLATRVGEAARVLDDDMLVEYNGTLIRTIRSVSLSEAGTLLAEPERLEAGAKGIQRARALFDYNVLAGKLRAVLIEQALKPGWKNSARPTETRPSL